MSAIVSELNAVINDLKVENKTLEGKVSMLQESLQNTLKERNELRQKIRFLEEVVIDLEQEKLQQETASTKGVKSNGTKRS